jgi:hypothetical protein
MFSRQFNNCPAVNPERYLDLARELAGNPSPEYIRSAGDRAYYAAFLFCRDELAKKGYITPFYSTEDHNYVSRSLQQLFGRGLFSEFELRYQRNRINYDTRNLHGVSIPWMLKTAQDIIERVKALPPKQPDRL